jgi:hypothetical protein
MWTELPSSFWTHLARIGAALVKSLGDLLTSAGNASFFLRALRPRRFSIEARTVGKRE